MAGKRPRLKICVFWILSFLPLCVCFEVFSYLVVTRTVPTRIRARIGTGNVELHIAQTRKAIFESPDIVLASAPADVGDGREAARLTMFHSVLGWNYPADLVHKDVDGITYHHDPNGARRTLTSFKTSDIATYGDSFTCCANVNDDETWQNFLAHKIGANVLNFGVGGYGTDQAYLKYRLNHRLETKIVMLCILPENINRIVNIYRPFYVHEDPLALTKPRFIRHGDGFELIQNPVSTVPEMAKLENPLFLGRLGELDYWYKMDKSLPPFSFPFSRALFLWRGPVLQNLGLNLCLFRSGGNGASYPFNLFDQPEPLAIMCHIVDLFVETARSRGQYPVVVLIPHKDFVRELMDYRINRAANLIEYLRKKGYTFIDAVQAVAEMRPTPELLDKLYSGHATRAGNKLLAEILARRLKDSVK